MTTIHTGGCQCGRVRYTAQVDPAEAYLCHCKTCQRATGGFAAAFVHVAQADVAWQGEPDWYESSPIAKRPFCAKCGTPLGFQFSEGSKNMDLTVGSFDDPSDFRPKHHFGAESIHEAWLDTKDLPRIRTQDYVDEESAGVSDVRREFFEGFGGARLALHRLGAGRPVILLHGLFSSAEMNWIRFGHAQQLADAGFEALMPDLRAHGASAKPHDAASYPPDVLARDAEALVAHLGVDDYDLVGFSLGARTAVRSVLAGLRPRKLVLGGMGLEGLAGWNRRAAFFLDVIARYGTIRPGDPAYMAQQFMKSMAIDREAARLLLGTMADTAPAALAAIAIPTLVLCGEQDDDNGDPDALSAALPYATRATVPGTHMGSVTQPELGRELVAFLTGTD